MWVSIETRSHVLSLYVPPHSLSANAIWNFMFRALRYFRMCQSNIEILFFFYGEGAININLKSFLIIFGFGKSCQIALLEIRVFFLSFAFSRAKQFSPPYVVAWSEFERTFIRIHCETLLRDFVEFMSVFNTIEINSEDKVLMKEENAFVEIKTNELTKKRLRSCNWILNILLDKGELYDFLKGISIF